jgi:ribosomal RNA methyltransferase Nop2
MVYSTCSTAPEEDEFIIADAIRQLNVEIVDTALGFGDEGFRKAFGVTLPEELRLARRFYPHKHGVEGFFLSKLKKRLQ